MASKQTPAETKLFSPRIERVREAKAALDENDEHAKVEAEIEASKVHWSELTSHYFTAVEGPATESSSSSQSGRANEVKGTSEGSLTVAEENVQLFRSLQQQYPGGFFLDEDDAGSDRAHKLPWYMVDRDGHPSWVKVELSSEKPFAEGAQAELFHAHGICEDGSKILEKWLVMKVFKKGTSLKVLRGIFPSTLLMDDGIQKDRIFGLQTLCYPLVGVKLLKCGRLAFVMLRAWGDLRKLIDERMVHFSNNGPPFENNVAIHIMYRIARGMQDLHKENIIHRDLKASNVLIWSLLQDHVCKLYQKDLKASNVLIRSYLQDHAYELDPIPSEPHDFWCCVADYECSIGIVGTRFWRAPEILLGLKNRSIFQNLEVFSKQSDVYSFGMTCYEILSGGIPLEELQASDYDGVIGGKRPTLPYQTTPWMMDLVNRCWHKDPLLRPSFEEIVTILKPHVFEHYISK